MTFTRNGTLVEIGDPETLGSFRIEPGPVRKVETATPELLADDRTLDHYFEGQRDTGMKDNDGNPIYHTGVDALGVEIKTGEPMTFNDWVGFQQGREDACCFYLYRLEKRTVKEIEDLELGKNPPPVWREVETFPTEDEAINAALSAK